jgi:hypothetical protein
VPLSFRRFGNSRNVEVPAHITHTRDVRLSFGRTLRSRPDRSSGSLGSSKEDEPNGRYIKCHQAGGPDEERNGLALCSLHHKLFDRGVFTICNSMSVIVSESANGTRGFQEWVIAYHERRFDRRNAPTITLMKIGSPGTCERYSKVLVGIKIVISTFREFSKRGSSLPYNSQPLRIYPLVRRVRSPFESYVRIKDDPKFAGIAKLC